VQRSGAKETPELRQIPHVKCKYTYDLLYKLSLSIFIFVGMSTAISWAKITWVGYIIATRMNTITQIQRPANPRDQAIASYQNEDDFVKFLKLFT